jgi:hypothetical protein
LHSKVENMLQDPKNKKWKARQLFNLVIKGQEQRILPVYLHLIQENLDWMTRESDRILKELCLVVVDNLELLQQQTADLENETMTSFHRLRGETISLAYKIQKRTDSWCSVLSCDGNGNLNVLPKASFVLNPLYIFPYGTYPLLPGPTQTPTPSITNYFKVVKP